MFLAAKRTCLANVLRLRATGVAVSWIRLRRRMNTAVEMPMTFTLAEHDYIRRELDMFSSTLPSVADGFQLKTWGGKPAGKPNLSPAATGFLERIPDPYADATAAKRS
jgi:hypothetical protein